MSFKPTIVVLVLAALGVAAVFYVEQREAPAQEIAGPHAFLSADTLPVDDVDRITLSRGTETPLVFERGEDGWMQTQPFAYPMDNFSIRQLIVLARELETDDELVLAATDDDSRASLGLDPPAAIIRYDWSEGSVELQLGRRGVAGRAYVLVAGSETVHVVNQDLHDRAVAMNPKEWRDRTIFPGVSVEADRVVRANGSDRLELVSDRKQWSMALPVTTRLEPKAQDDYFLALGRAQCSGFIADEPEDLSRYGLEEPAASLSVVMSRPIEVDGRVVDERETHTLKIGAPVGVGSPDRFAIVEGRPVVVRLSEPVLLALFRAPETLIDKTGSGLDPADVKSIVMTGPEGELMLTRDLEQWVAPAFDGVPVPRELPEELLRLLTKTPADAVEIREYPYDYEFGYVTMHGFDGAPKDTVRIIRDPDTGRWGLENGDGVIRIFAATTRVRLTPADYGLE